MYAHPGKKLLFMGSEIAQSREWTHEQSLDWHLLQYGFHSGVQKLVRDLNTIYRNTPALHEIDFSGEGFEWIDWSDRDNSILSWLRRDRQGRHIVCVSNFTPVVREGFRLGVPELATYREVLNSDSHHYGGSNVGNAPQHSAEHGAHGRPYSLTLTLPPLATLYLTPGS